jgi:hypothetical protein
MMLSDRTPGFVISVQPMAHQRLHDEPRIAKMPCAILLEIRPELSVEPVRPLLGLWLAYPFGLIARSSCCCHNKKSIDTFYVMQACKKVFIAFCILLLHPGTYSCILSVQPCTRTQLSLPSRLPSHSPYPARSGFAEYYIALVTRSMRTRTISWPAREAERWVGVGIRLAMSRPFTFRRASRARLEKLWVFRPTTGLIQSSVFRSRWSQSMLSWKACWT